MWGAKILSAIDRIKNITQRAYLYYYFYYITGWDPCDTPRKKDPFGGPDRPAPPEQCPEEDNEPQPLPPVPPEPPPAPPPDINWETFFPPELRWKPDDWFADCATDVILEEVAIEAGAYGGEKRLRNLVSAPWHKESSRLLEYGVSVQAPMALQIVD